MDGILNIYKEKGYTSHDVVARMRGILRTRKIGHTGTLDPDATGVLPVCVGAATKLVEMLTDHDKVYEAELTFGTVTDTQDITGVVVCSASDKEMQALDSQKVKEAILSFVGPYDQIPPMYSALKVNGQKLCDLARRGIEVERSPRPVEVYDIEIVSIDLPKAVIRAHVSKGTYIRTLIHDIGQKLGVGACMSSLERVRVAQFSIKDSITLQELEVLRDEDRLSEVLCLLEDFFKEHAAYRMLPDWERFLLNGNEVSAYMLEPVRDGKDTQVVLYDSGMNMKGLYEFSKEKNRFCPVRMFL